MNLASFPILSIKPDNISGSYSEWLDEFELAIEIKSLEMGFDEVTIESSSGSGTRKVSRFTEKARTLVLLKCIGNEGRRVLASEGYTDLANREEPMYRQILQTLHNILVILRANMLRPTALSPSDNAQAKTIVVTSVGLRP